MCKINVVDLFEFHLAFVIVLMFIMIVFEYSLFVHFATVLQMKYEMLYRTVLYYTVLNYNTLYCTVLYCTIL